MSLVYITFHNENVLDLDKEDQLMQHETVEYTSKFHRAVEKEKQFMHIMDLGDNKKLLTSSARYDHHTMGCAETPLAPPCNFLRKNQGIKWQRRNDHKCPPKREVQPIPLRSQLPKDESQQCYEEKQGSADGQTKTICIKAPRRNFVAYNIDTVKNAQCKRPPPRYVDTPTGDRHDLINAGLIPQFTCSKNFGRVPCYIKARKKFLKKINEKCQEEKALAQRTCVRTMDNLSGLRKLTPEERQDILSGLKQNFADIFKIYNSLSLYTDTQAKKLRKGKLEGQLRQLEQDMFLMESNPEIYVNEY